MKSLWFIRHQWKKWTRSTHWQKNVLANIALILLFALLLSYIVVLGIFIDKILLEIYPDEDPVILFNSGLIYFYLAGLFFRYLAQSLPTLNIEAYIHLPVKKNTLVNFVIFKSMISIFNFLPLLILIPFALKVVLPWYNAAVTATWLASVILLVFANNFLLSYLKRQVTSKAWITGIIFLALIVMIGLDYFSVFSLLSISGVLFGYLLQGPVFILFPILWLVFTYYLNYTFLRSRLYPEKVNNRKAVRVDRFTGARYFESLGLTGELITLEMKLWLRHKRTKSQLYMFPIFVLYGFFFYPMEAYQNAWGFLIFVGIFMSGGLMMNYLNYAFGYESNYFDTILTKEIDMRKYLKAKLLIGLMISSICYIVTIPYLFFGMHILAINTATFIFNIGVLSYVLLYMATYNKKRIDLTKGAAFNYQGMSAMNWLAVIPAFLMPVLIYLPFGSLGYRYTGLVVVAILGLAGFFMGKYLLSAIYRNLNEKKYLMAEGFRE